MLCSFPSADSTAEIGVSALEHVLDLASAMPEDRGLFIAETQRLRPGTSQLTISGNNAVRVLDVSAGASLSLDGLTVANGFSSDGGGVFNNGALNVSNSTFEDNTSAASGEGFAGGGGGIFNYGGVVSVTNSTSGFYPELSAYYERAVRALVTELSNAKID